ncbi:DNA primase [Acinetobacter phage vB_AbaP_APK87]|uniref:DNA primase n=1 Tax=Acinetobacter phage vB_AbaP_APK87 TaxID=2664209 RepID=A0A6M3AKK4_9CAUD|nr:DNA primase [Acinetobacter phage vB_AbaP_APK87]
MLHSSEWLADAQAVPLGQKRRVWHGAEHTKAMDVYNNLDSWSCWCHRCHEGGKVWKTHLARETLVQAPTIKHFLNYKQLCTLTELAEKHESKYKRMVVLLQSKGVSTTILQPYRPMYNLEDDRLVFSFEGVDIGRDCTGVSPMKWYKYYKENPKSFVYLQGKNQFDTREPVAVTEDLFSSMKIKHYSGCSAMCLLGTNFEDEKLNFLSSRKPVLALDGDLAGQTAERLISNRLSLFAVPYLRVSIPLGLDPKDLKPNEIKQLFSEL